MTESKPVLLEPWLRGSVTDVAAVPRAVLHALELAKEDLEKWCGPLTDEQLNRRPAALAPVAFHLRHISRSIDRLLSYAEGSQLNEEQFAGLKTELDPGAKHTEVFQELAAALDRATGRVRVLAHGDFSAERFVGKRQLPTTLGGLLVHVADHTQRHVGQAITTANLVATSAPL